MGRPKTPRDLRGIMRFICGYPKVNLNTAKIIQDLRTTLGLSRTVLNECLDALDIEYLRVKWNGHRSAVGISEIVRYDFTDLGNAETGKPVQSETATALPEKAAVMTARQDGENSGELEKLVRAAEESLKKMENERQNLQSLIGKIKALTLKQKVGTIGICQKCQKEKKIFSKDKCSACYQQDNRLKKVGICADCQKEKLIAAKGRCTTCYPKYWQQNRITQPQAV